jgi:phage shock protein PspC (stress-responsive transcriptional regulator)
MNAVKDFIEWKVFGVCSYLGDRMGIATDTIRKYVIYISLITMGSPIVFYLFIAFWMNIKQYIGSKRRNPVRNF